MGRKFPYEEQLETVILEGESDSYEISSYKYSEASNGSRRRNSRSRNEISYLISPSASRNEGSLRESVKVNRKSNSSSKRGYSELKENNIFRNLNNNGNECSKSQNRLSVEKSNIKDRNPAS